MLILAGLFLLGLCFGSFVNALVWRLRQQELAKNPPSPRLRRAGKEQRTLLRQGYEGQAKSKEQENNSSTPSSQFSIFGGRSQCPNCGHKLSASDLVPILSWLILRRRCRYCKKPISIQYPLVEIICGLVFALSYIYWPLPLASGQWLLFITWLASSVGLLALAAYDLKWMLLPNRILYPTLFIALIGQLGYILFFADNKAHNSWLLTLSVLVASGFFAAIYLVSKGRWIGFGDVRLGLIIGVLLATPAKSFMMIFLASVLGMLFVLPALAGGRKNLTSKLPFGPFLIMATAIIVLFGQPLLDWYTRLLA